MTEARAYLETVLRISPGHLGARRLAVEMGVPVVPGFPTPMGWVGGP